MNKFRIKHLIRFCVHPFVHVYDIVTPTDNREEPVNLHKLSVLRRKSDGKYYRGSRWWTWCNNPRHAGWLDYEYWTTFITWKLDRKNIEYELIPLTHLEI